MVKLKISEKIAEQGPVNPELHASILELEDIFDSLQSEAQIISEPPGIMINPTVRPYMAKWKGLAELFLRPEQASRATLERGEELLLIWWDPMGCQVRMEAASEKNLLALKMVEEDLDPKEVAQAGNLPVGAVDGAIEEAVRKGLLLPLELKKTLSGPRYLPFSGILPSNAIFIANTAMTAATALLSPLMKHMEYWTS